MIGNHEIVPSDCAKAYCFTPQESFVSLKLCLLTQGLVRLIGVVRQLKLRMGLMIRPRNIMLFFRAFTR